MKSNLGAGPSRNCALRETSADWALFLDDDVIPSTSLLHAYGRHILARTAANVNGNGTSNGNGNGHQSNRNGTGLKDTTDSLVPAPASASASAFAPATPTATATATSTTTTICGFIGKTEFPPATSWLLHSVVLSDVTYMYGISDALPCPAWGPTANVLIRVAAEPWVGGGSGTRSTVGFGDTFPKTGGGEDVDFCIRFEHERGGTFAAAPDAVVTHPWWPGGRITTFRRFFRWSSGDGQLFDLHQQHCYHAAPNVAESMLLAVILSLLILSLAHWASHLQWSPPLPGIAVTATAAVAFVLSAPLVVLASEMIYDVCRNSNKARARERLPKVRGVARVFAAAGASCVIATLETGRLVGHAKRGGLKAVCKNFCRRFDWHCGRQEGAVGEEKRRALGKVVLHSACFVAVAGILLGSSKEV